MRSDLNIIDKVMLGLLLILIAALFNYAHLTKQIDNIVYDAHLGLWSRTPTEDIILVTIDDRSLEQLGRWPWPRRFHAKLLGTLKDSKAVGLDVLFSEADNSDPDGDLQLSRAIAEHGRVVLPISPVMVSSEDLTDELYSAPFEEKLRELSSLPIFDHASKNKGHVDVELDYDGISRSVFLTAGVGLPQRSALPLAMIELHDHIDISGLRNKKPTSNENVWVRDHQILLPFSNTPHYFKKISFVDAIDPRFDPSLFKDKWVLIGMDAIGLSDRIPTPIFHSKQPMSGVEFEAQVLDILLNDISIKPLDDHRNFLLTIPFVVALLLLFNLLRTERTWLATFLPIAGVLCFCVILSRLGFMGMHFWFRPGPALVALFIGYLVLHRQQLMTFISSLIKEKEHREVAMSTVSDAVVITDNAGHVEFMNPSAEALTGFLLENVRGHPLSEVMLLQNHDGEPYPIDLVTKSQMLNSRVELPENYFLKQRDGLLLPVRANAKPFVDDEKVTGVVVAFDEQKKDAASVIDPLTRLPSLSLLHDRLEHAISNASRTKRLIAVLYIDLNDFNKVNDAFGIETGDKVLKEVALRLTARGRSGDTVARVGHDEFVVMLENLEDIEPVASVTTSLLEAIREPHKFDGHEIVVEGSIGISVYPKDGLDAKILNNNAYTAMKRAKKSRQQDVPRFRFYSQKMNKSALDRMLSEKDLRNALAEDKFELYYQPRVDFITGQIVAVEALIRWRRPGEGLVLPTSFIPLAERSGLITEIGEWVLLEACQQAKSWENAGLPRPRMSINLSPRQFMQHDLLDTITRILDKVELDPRYLELEITENSLVKDVDRCIEVLNEFRAVGGTVSIDDFGTGYSSLSYLKNFPVDMLKIDKVFINEITTEPDHAAITLAVISMAHSLNLQVVAEGVETEAQFDFLRAKGCDELQGYFFSKPLPASEMTKMLEEKRHMKIAEISDHAATTLLLVDDDSEILTHMGIMLRNEGYQILMAHSGEEALNLLAKHAVGIVVSDEVMPGGMSGSTLLEKIKNLYPKTIRILFSATADRETIIQAINSGAIFKFVNKPISEKGFKKVLKEGFNYYNKTLH